MNIGNWASVRVRGASGIRACANARITPAASRLGMLASICEPRRNDGTPEKLGTEMAMSRWKPFAASRRSKTSRSLSV